VRDHHVTCQELVEIVTEYLEHALDAGTAERFEEHLNFCDGCAAHVAQVRTTIAIVDAAEPEAPPVTTHEQLMSAFRDWRRI
jgi:anti-sigma factor RsiW